MDVELMKSSSQNQMEMMKTVMQLDKLPQFYHNLQESPFFDFSSSYETISPPSFDHNPYTITSPLVQNPLFAPNTENPIRFPYSNTQNKKSSMEAMREMIFRMAMMQPVHIDPESVKPPKRRNVKISKDPQSVAARHRRERISERIRILQRLVPGGTKMDTASMLDEAIHYLKFLKKQVESLERVAGNDRSMCGGFSTTMEIEAVDYLSLMNACQHDSVVGSMDMFS